MPRQKDNDKERPKRTRKPKVNEFVEQMERLEAIEEAKREMRKRKKLESNVIVEEPPKAPTVSIKKKVEKNRLSQETQEETPEIVSDEEEETQKDEDYEIQDVDEENDLNDEQDDLFEEKEEKHGYSSPIKFKNVNEKDKVTIRTNFMSKVMAREIDELLTSVTLVLDFLHMVNEKKEATFTLKSEKTYVVILCTIYNFFRTLSKSNTTILGSFTTRTLKDLIIFIKSLNNVELATFVDAFNTFKNILILIKFIKGTKKLKYLNTDKLDVDYLLEHTFYFLL
ncbi:hypothetical protein ABK040_003629 [Willaertia magna]